ncbi:hypothetical protein PV325_012960 [Microctonus aethiopoides]|nr:hypothetical protein PV325_012960 [Microctonus aethiopoides]
MNRWSITVFIVTIFLAGLLSHCAGNVIFEKETRRQPSTGSILVEIAKELMLNLNLSNLLLLMVLKAVVFGANFIGSNNDEKSRGLDSDNIVTEEEISLALGYLISDKCLYRAACEVPNTARDYLDAVEIVVQTMKLMPEFVPINKSYDKAMANFRKAIEYGAMKQCPPEYNCKKQSINSFLRAE